MASLIIFRMEAVDMPIDPLELRLAMRQWTTGVTIVSAEYQVVHHGMTVSSFFSVSLTPPTVLISLEKITRTYAMVRDSGFFGVNILSSDQEEISDRFAGRHTENRDRFYGLETTTLISGAPFLKDSLVCLDCQVIARLDSGTHTVFLGEVLSAAIHDQKSPLVYFDQHYHRLQD